MLNTAGLSLEQAPPISVPLRFFLTAPVFAGAAGVLLAWSGVDLAAGRWTPIALAVVHLITLGFLTQAMCGALFQMLPVLAGAPVAGVVAVGRWTHVLLASGTVGLCVGFLGGGPAWLVGGAVTASIGLCTFLVAAGGALLRPASVSSTVWAMRLALIALAVTVGLGLALVWALAGWAHLERFTAWVDLHLTWGLLGWAGLLIMGVGYQVVPMFHVTPPYPRLLTLSAAPIGFVGIAAALALTGLDVRAPVPWATGLAIAAFVAFGLATLEQQRRRQRRRLDATLFHWWSAIGAVVLAAVVWLFRGPDTLVGVLVLLGVGVGLPSGMLFKIAPFLGWFHLQHRQVVMGRFDHRLPTMHSFLPERAARIQFWMHLLALVLLVSGVLFEPALVHAGGAALALSSAMLWGLLVRNVMLYRRHAIAVGAAPDAAVGADPRA